MKDEARVMTHDIKNPKFDGRARYGFKAIPMLKKGTVFTFTPSSRDAEDGAVDLAFIRINDTLEQIGREVEALIVEYSKPHTPTNWDEIAISMESKAGSWLAGEVLQHLLNTGAVSIEQLQSAAKFIHDGGEVPSDKADD